MKEKKVYHDHEGCGCAMCELEGVLGGHKHEHDHDDCDCHDHDHNNHDDCDCHNHHHHDHEGCGCAMCELEGVLGGHNHEHNHDDCDCHDHHHNNHDDCDCHDHHHHDHEGCGCAMCELEGVLGGHNHEHDHDDCDCHDHHHHDHEGCGCAMCELEGALGGHKHEHDHDDCDCHDHHHNHDHEGCGCAMCELEGALGGHNHEHDHDYCDCHDHHHHDHEGCGCAMCELENPSKPAKNLSENKPSKLILAGKVLIAAIALLAGWLWEGNILLTTGLSLAAVVVWGKELFQKAFQGLRRRELDENVLMSVAVVAAFILGETFESIMVVLLYSLGEFLEAKAVRKSRRDIEEVINIRPQKANLLKADGSITEVDSSKLHKEDLILVRVGERVPVDGIVEEGDSAMDQSALTGESAAVGVGAGDKVLSGSVNLSGVLKVRAKSAFYDSTASRMIRLVEESSAQKGKTEKVITRFSKVYTPLVILAAVLVAVLPPILGAGDFKTWTMNSLVFLVASCPCALIISVPLALYSGVGAISRCGVLVKGTRFLEPLSKASAVVMDKTGTITTGELTVSQIYAQQDKEQFLRLTALAEGYSSHPIAQAVEKELADHILAEDKNLVGEVKEIAGRGISMDYAGKKLLCGSARFLQEEGIEISDCPSDSVYTAYDGVLLGGLLLSDFPRKEAQQAIREWKEEGIKQTVMLTGDSRAVAQEVQKNCGIDKMYAELLPQDKLTQLQKLKEETENIVFIGDGINDAPVLAAADVGVAMGMGTDAAIEAADAVLMSEKLTSLTNAIRLSKKTMGIVYFNIAFILIVKLLVFTLGAFGMMTMWMAVLSDVGVSILAVLNAVRILKIKVE